MLTIQVGCKFAVLPAKIYPVVLLKQPHLKVKLGAILKVIPPVAVEITS